MRDITIDGRRIADDEPCYVIAEIGNNHSGSVTQATRLIQAAALCGAHAAKCQTRHNDTLYTREMLAAPYEHEQSYGKTYGEHRRALELAPAAYTTCQRVAAEQAITFFSTPFDERSLAFLVDVLHVPAIKLPSSAVTDVAMLTAASRTGLPVLLSTGGSTCPAIDAAVERLTAGRSPFALLHCTAAYPVQRWAELNLRAIPAMRTRYPGTVIGWSGHDSGIAMSLVAYAYGARIIEKHFTLNRSLKGTDHVFSLEPAGLTKLCRDLGRAHDANGDGVKRVYDSEVKPLAKMRRQPTAHGLQITGDVLYADDRSLRSA